MPDVRVGQEVSLTARSGVSVDTKIVDATKTSNKWVKKYDARAMRFFVEELKFRVFNRDFDCWVMVTGDERTGKSTVVIYLARLINPDFSVDNVVFRIENFNKKIDTCPNQSIIIFDEAGHDLFSQEWYNQFQRNLAKKAQVIGKKNLIIFLVLPHISELNSRFRKRRVRYWMHTRTTDNLERGFVQIRRGITSKWKSEKYWKPFLFSRFHELHDDFWKEYNEKKDAFIDEVSRGDREVLGTQEERYKHQRDLLIRSVYSMFDVTQKEVAHGLLEGALSRSQVANILADVD